MLVVEVKHLEEESNQSRDLEVLVVIMKDSSSMSRTNIGDQFLGMKPYVEFYVCVLVWRSWE